MKNTADKIFIMRQQMNILYKLIAKANLYICLIDDNTINIDRLEAEIAAIHKSLEFIENELL